MTPVYLSIAGSDCSAGAGLQADLKAGFALGCYPLTAVTCVVSEIPGLVDGIVAMDPEFVSQQVRICMKNFPVAAIKTGMLYSPEIVRAVAAELEGNDIPLVVDPVMIATAGEALMLQEAVAVYEECIIPRTTVLTPNVDELCKLLGTEILHTEEELTAAGRELASRYGCAILAKGGHIPGKLCTDLLITKDGQVHRFSHPRTEGISTHGTGCTLSSALAACLAQGDELVQATARALDYTAGAIAHSHKLGELYALNHHSC